MKKVIFVTIFPLTLAFGFNFIIDTELAFGFWQPLICSWLPLVLVVILILEKGKCRVYGLCLFITLIPSEVLRVKFEEGRKEKTVQCVQVIIDALERYKVESGHYPGDLDDMKPKYLAEIPKSKMTVVFKRKIYYSLRDEGTNYSLFFELPKWRRIGYMRGEDTWEEYGD